ncbi:hypothetical protein DY000_02016542 [Brassica cretica]|uniref:Uncharacterized protein n=1 Tax=Brassica cretica TaxID=69181 RepID=A0ABQ7CUS7_BRACR|nr:hypothetical protein DY000_02016542 [Brassica cretica]
MVSSLIQEARNQKATYRAIANRLEQAERELVEHRANARERNQPPPDSLGETLNPQITGAFVTLEIPSARSRRYAGENSQRPPQQSMLQRSLSYSGLDEINTGLQAQRSTPIQSQNIYMERTGETRNRMPPLGNLTSENRTPSAARTAQQTGFNNPIGQLAKQATKGQHSYAINNSPQNKSSTYNPRKHCAFHDRKGHSTEECRVALRSQSENKKTSEDTEEEEEEPATPKSNRKTKGSSNKRSRETKPESPSSPPPMQKKRVDMISWGLENHTPDRIERQTKGRVCIDITVAVRTLENLNKATPPPSITRYNPNAGPPCGVSH